MTVKDHLMTLPEPHRSRALKYETAFLNIEVKDLKQAIRAFKYWHMTHEGSDYWDEVKNGNYSKALEICPITEDERHLIEPNIVQVSSGDASNDAIDWLYLQYEIYGYLTHKMVKKAKEKAQ